MELQQAAKTKAERQGEPDTENFTMNLFGPDFQVVTAHSGVLFCFPVNSSTLFSDELFCATPL